MSEKKEFSDHFWSHFNRQVNYGVKDIIWISIMLRNADLASFISMGEITGVVQTTASNHAREIGFNFSRARSKGQLCYEDIREFFNTFDFKDLVNNRVTSVEFKGHKIDTLLFKAVIDE